MAIMTKRYAEKLQKIVESRKDEYNSLPKRLINKHGNKLELTVYCSYIDPDETSSYAQEKNAISYKDAIKYGYKPYWVRITIITPKEWLW